MHKVLQLPAQRGADTRCHRPQLRFLAMPTFERRQADVEERRGCLGGPQVIFGLHMCSPFFIRKKQTARPQMRDGRPGADVAARWNMPVAVDALP